jgi:hypothetical protein
LDRFANGNTYYDLYERGGKWKDGAVVFADGTCKYRGKACAPDDPRLLALIAQVAPVEVRPAAQATHPLLGPPLAPKQSSDGSAGSFCPRRRWRRPWPPRCIPMPHAVAGGRATQPNHQSHCNARPRSDACTDRFGVVVTREAASCTLTSAAWCTNGPSRQLRCHAIVQHAAVPNAATRDGLHVTVHTSHARCDPQLLSHPVPQSAGVCPRAFVPGFAVLECSGLAGRGSRGQPADALGGARALRPPSLRTARRGTCPGTPAALH